MSDTGKLGNDPLFVGLTRPPMFLGVSYKFAMLNGIGNLLYFINHPNLIVVVLGILVMHGIAYIICFKEPLFIELYSVRVSKCTKCRNRLFHHATNSYDMF
jgi:type IV secretion system protein VirB3